MTNNGNVMIKRIGFYREFNPQNPDDSAPSIHDDVRSHALHDESQTLEYMSSSVEIYSTMGADRDVISDDEWIPGAGSLVTDGTWLWPVELEYYVRRYHVELPEDFLTDIRASNYTPPTVPHARVVEIFNDVFGPSAFQAARGSTEITGFFSWYLSDLTVQTWGRLLRALKSVGLDPRDRFTDDMFLSGTREGNEFSRSMRSEPDVVALLADPGDGEVALHLWFDTDTSPVVRVRRLDDTTTAVVHDLTGLLEPEREEVVAALVQALDSFRDDCRGFVLDRAGRTSPDAWDALVVDHAWPSGQPFPDSVAITPDLGAPPSGADAVTRTDYGHLTVFSRNSTSGPQA
ncbi:MULTISPECIES: hypothetical protein [unclassified Streptomyces]|uniref:hypothetical protein n=1 Tax=unclassified Streptomyces TaxID=2593676 RepID=UPI00380BFDA7